VLQGYERAAEAMSIMKPVVQYPLQGTHPANGRLNAAPGAGDIVEIPGMGKADTRDLLKEAEQLAQGAFLRATGVYYDPMYTLLYAVLPSYSPSFHPDSVNDTDLFRANDELQKADDIRNKLLASGGLSDAQKNALRDTMQQEHDAVNKAINIVWDDVKGRDPSHWGDMQLPILFSAMQKGAAESKSLDDWLKS
jgi:hypothetical protein